MKIMSIFKRYEPYAKEEYRVNGLGMMRVFIHLNDVEDHDRKLLNSYDVFESTEHDCFMVQL